MTNANVVSWKITKEHDCWYVTKTDLCIGDCWVITDGQHAEYTYPCDKYTKEQAWEAWERDLMG